MFGEGYGLDLPDRLNGELYGTFAIRLVRNGANFWLASDALEVEALLRLGIIEEVQDSMV